MKLLKLSDKDLSEFDRFFEETQQAAIEKAAPQVVDEEEHVRINGDSVESFDAVFAEIPEKNAVFGRVLLELIEEKDINLNYPSTAFFIMAKKNYLYSVLHEKDIPAPKTVAISSRKSARNIYEHLKGPLIARKFENMEETERSKLDEVQDIEEFAEGSEHPENVLLFHEMPSGDKYKCLYAGGTVISLLDSTDSWKVKDEKLKYSSISSDQEETVRKTARNLGTPVAEVILRGEKVADVNPNPDLEQYTEISGKDAYQAVSEALKSDNE